ncbi:MAG: DUF805 domain-containing protein [Limisphaerales bacterium]
MSFSQSIKTCFKKYVDSNGRASRSEFWYFQLFLIILYFLADIIDYSVLGTGIGQTGYASLTVQLGTFLPAICVSIRRLHDVERSGWWVLIALTCVGIIPLIFWEASKGVSGPNEHGEDPLATDQTD